MKTEFILFNLFLLVLLSIDLGLVHRKTREISSTEALKWCGFWGLLALLFAAGLFFYSGTESGFQFLTGYVIEMSLSVDNILLFVLIFRHFNVPANLQHRVLFWGVIGALIMRLGLILLGATIISRYQWILYLFGAFLLITGIKMLFMPESEKDLQDNFLIAFLRKWLPITPGYVQNSFIVKIEGRWAITPLLLVLVMIESTDLIFAVDSIPAIFAVTKDPFIIYTSNAFAIMGLRSLYFALAHLLDRLRYLKVGLSIVLIFIGCKMLLEKWIHLPASLSLGITLVILTSAVLISLKPPRGEHK